MKANELTGAALDWAVALCEDYDIVGSDGWIYIGFAREPYSPSTNWGLGGPIIKREKIRLDCSWDDGPWSGSCKIDGVTAWVEGATPLEAAMRCYVASKLGDDIEIPEGLQ